MKIKTILILFLLCLRLSSFSQSDSLYKFFEVENNKLVYYYNGNANLTLKARCSYYRVLEYPPKIFPYAGEILDYFKSGELAFKTKLQNGLLEGEAVYYYPNGNIKIEAKYEENTRSGIWNFYYPNSNIEKRIEYKNDNVYIIDYYTKSGQQLVVNGNGQYESIAHLGTFHELEYRINGNVKDSLFDGKWKIGDAIEEYKNGKLIKGHGVARNAFSNLYAQEKLNIFRSVVIGKYTFDGTRHKYSYSDSLTNFRLQLNSDIYKLSQKINLKSFWILLSFQINNKGEIGKHNLITSDSILLTYITNYIQGLKWKKNLENNSYGILPMNIEETNKNSKFRSHKKFNKIHSLIFMPIVYVDSGIVIPSFSLYKK